MIKRNNRTLTYIFALGITLAQCSMLLLEYKHPFHQPDSKCAVCLVADHLSHAMVYVPPMLHIDRAVSLLVTESAVFIITSFSFRYFIRAPPTH
ncbi:MAG: hypothetical protein LJE85_11910 [Gammaproteobacteria bacterium]|jgi:hypothetical protein|nr:hypothetical protein [Gammaproteobacteria bacterium]